MKKRITALLLAAALLLSACGGGSTAATMDLVRTEGTVGVSDDSGKTVTPRKNMKLYSGYGVSTQLESYAWIDLDRVKLAKLDADSEIQIQKDEKLLEIVLTKGSVFFNVTEPLAEDETMTIRTGDIAMGIRGTCGWVTAADSRHMTVHILEGTVVCTVTEAGGRVMEASVSAGESAALSVTEEGNGQIRLGTFTEFGVPAFVLEEIQEDGALAQAIAEESGLALQDWDQETALRQALEAVGYLGDAAACTMTPAHQAAFAQVLRAEIDQVEQNFVPLADNYIKSSRPVCLAALLDVGGGYPALLFGSAMEVTTAYDSELWGGTSGTVWGIFEYIDGQVVKREPDRTAVYRDYLMTGGSYVADPGYDASVYAFGDGRISAQPTTSAQEDYGWDWDMENGIYTVDGRETDRAAVEAWQAQWDKREDALAGYDHGSDVSCRFWGLTDAKSVLSVLEGNGPLADGTEEPDTGRTIVSYDPSGTIRRTYLDCGDLPLEIFYEIPVFSEPGEGYQKMNAFFQAKQDAFFADEAARSEERELARTQNPYQEVFCNGWYAALSDTQREGLISVIQSQEYYMGGPHPWTGLETHTFRADTGEELGLLDVVEATDAQVREAIYTYVSQLEAAEEYVDFETLRGRRVEEFRFFVREGQAVVTFDMYECTLFRAAIEDVPLPFPLRF